MSYKRAYGVVYNTDNENQPIDEKVFNELLASIRHQTKKPSNKPVTNKPTTKKEPFSHLQASNKPIHKPKAEPFSHLKGK